MKVKGRVVNKGDFVFLRAKVLVVDDSDQTIRLNIDGIGETGWSRQSMVYSVADRAPVVGENVCVRDRAERTGRLVAIKSTGIAVVFWSDETVSEEPLDSLVFAGDGALPSGVSAIARALEL